MEFYFDRLVEKDKKSVIDILNYYIENSFAAYPEKKLGYEFFDLFLKTTADYPAITVKNKSGEVFGFSYLRPHHPSETFKRTAEITYFIMPDYTGRQIGKSILDFMFAEAKKIGVDSILANISSLNPISINFHLKHGFKECGRFSRIGKKFNKDFDVIWMQKIL